MKSPSEILGKHTLLFCAIFDFMAAIYSYTQDWYAWSKFMGTLAVVCFAFYIYKPDKKETNEYEEDGQDY